MNCETTKLVGDSLFFDWLTPFNAQSLRLVNFTASQYFCVKFDLMDIYLPPSNQ